MRPAQAWAIAGPTKPAWTPRASETWRWGLGVGLGQGWVLDKLGSVLHTLERVLDTLRGVLETLQSVPDTLGKFSEGGDGDGPRVGHRRPDEARVHAQGQRDLEVGFGWVLDTLGSVLDALERVFDTLRGVSGTLESVLGTGRLGGARVWGRGSGRGWVLDTLQSVPDACGVRGPSGYEARPRVDLRGPDEARVDTQGQQDLEVGFRWVSGTL